MRPHNTAILTDTFGARISAIRALAAAAEGRGLPSDLRTAAVRLDEASAQYGDARIGAIYAAFAELVRVAALLTEWRGSVLEAEADAGRFLRGATSRAQLWIRERGELGGAERLAKVARSLTNDLRQLEDATDFCRALALVPLPIGVFAGRRPREQHDANDEPPEPPPAELSVAFLSFTVDGEPASDLQSLTPREAHDLEIEVRVSRWPRGAETLALAPLTVEAASSYELPTFEFGRPLATEQPPYVLRRKGRAVITFAQAARASPFEFRYAARFAPQEVEQPLTVGHRTLRIESVDLQKIPLSGYPGVDQRIFEIRRQLREKGVPQDDIACTVAVLARLGNLSGRALQGAIFESFWEEKRFQVHTRELLRSDPFIGVGLEEHPHAAGGVTDLSFGGIRIELKAEHDAPLSLRDCTRFVEQTASYAVGSGKRIAILCVLDTALRAVSPPPPEDSMGCLQSSAGVEIPTVLIKGNLARPSDLSKKSRMQSGRAKRKQP